MQHTIKAKSLIFMAENINEGSGLESLVFLTV